MSQPSGRGTTFRDKLKSKVEPLLRQKSSTTLQEKFFGAVYTRNIPKIVKYLESGVNPNVFSEEYGVCPLHLVAERNDFLLGYKMMQIEGINLEIRTVHGETPLGLTAMCNCKKFASLLLQYGHRTEVTNRLGKTPLHQAIEREYFGIVLKLLRAGASVNVLDCFGNTPLSLSILDVKNYAIARTLFQYGVNFRVERKRNLHIFFETVLHCSTISDIKFVVLLLEKGGIDINMVEKFGRTCLHYVAITGFIELAIVLIEKGADWNVVDVQRRTPARVAIEHGNEIMADYFRKGYRPPNLLAAMPLLQLFSSKMKAKVEERKKVQETESVRTQPKSK